MTMTVDLDRLLRAGWPAHTEVPVDGWIVRLSSGVTQRANSVLPLTAPADLAATLDRVEQLYRAHDVTPSFQIGPNAQPEHLDEVLAERGYQAGSKANIDIAAVEDVLAALVDSDSAPVRVSGEPDADWMDLWWSVDPRGNEAAKAVAHKILLGGDARYAVRRDEHGASAIGRLALVGDWAGLYCLAVRPDARRTGQAGSIIRALLEQARDQGVRHVWLQVLADNHGARALYRRLGFHTAAEYHYRRLG
ncbi:MAG TPA: GNAT family N-acetyltransferase [Pseudonocardiaceae bacterium]|jgi:ribosomal protein S18 acetylase RimI-like enzyme|nr:GNAT family N-acetyltransferase [Pseudonocardiaceae bacterium]